METSSFLDWGSLFLKVLDTQAASPFNYASPDRVCVIDYPTKLRKHGRGSQLYPHIVTSEDTSPLYIIEAVVRDYSGKFEQHSATFIVPSRTPTPNTHAFCAEWLPDLSVYMVRQVPYQAGPSKSLGATPGAGLRALFTHLQTEAKHNQVSVDDLFDIEYFPSLEDTDTFQRDESQYDLGLFAVRHADKTELPESSMCLSSSSEESELAELLKPENFDWSECDAEVIQLENSSQLSKEQQQDACEHFQSPGNNLRSHVTDQSGITFRTRGSDIMKCRTPFQEIRSVSLGPSKTEAITTLPCIAEEPEEVSDAPKEQLQASCGARPFEGMPEKDKLSLSHNDQHARDFLENVALSEASWQEWWLNNNPCTHHFNWLGQPVLERSYTPPEVSLFVIVTTPKPWLDSMSRTGVILRQAMKFVDPVLYDGRWNNLVEYRGQALVRAITGRTFKFYAGGKWPTDSYDWDDNVPCHDPISPSTYMTESWLPVNGWLGTCVSPTRERYFSKSARLLGELQRPTRRQRTSLKPSPLRHYITAAS